MTYDEKIPEFALQPAKADDDDMMADDGFDPTPYDRLLVPKESDPEKPAADAPIEYTPVMAPNPEDPELVEPVAAEAPEEEPVEDAPVMVETPLEEPVAVEEAVEPAAAQAPEEEIFQPVAAPMPVQKEEEALPAAAQPPNEAVKITPLASSAVFSDLKITSVAQKLDTKVYIEEDILVPDVKPDLISILSMDGEPILANKEIQVGQGEDDNVRVTGEVALQTIYLPEDKKEGEPIAIIQSRLPFKKDWQITASPLSHLAITPVIEKIDYTVVNERKFRAKITLSLTLKEYAEKSLQFFESLKGEDLQLLKEKVRMSHVALRKEEPVEIAEELEVKEGAPKPVKVLKYDVNVIENHKQLTSEKMVINATIWCNILYLGESEDEGETVNEPALFQAKTDFTQFILMNKEDNIAGNKVTFNSRDLAVKVSEEDENAFTLSGTVRTSVEIYQNIEKEVVSDLYHNINDTTYDYTERPAEAIMGNGTTEVSAREIFNIPESNGQVGKVLYISGKIKESSSTVEQGRGMVEGILESQILCLPADEEKKPFTLKQEMPFRGTMDIPAAAEGMKAESQIAIKDLWFDKINAKQVEVNASLQMEVTIVEERPIKLIKNPCFVESSKTKRPASMVVYITKKHDTLWKIAKKYKTTRNALSQINELEEGARIPEGTRLLIVK